MTALQWDRVGERFFQTGVDRGVLYLHDGTAVVWNGLTAVEDSSLQENQSYFLDGVKYLEKMLPAEFSGRLRALTYPDELDSLVGIEAAAEGLVYYDQPPQSFNLSYVTSLGNDVDGVSLGYKIHIFYNLVANPDAYIFETIRNPLKPVEFGWTLTGTPPKVNGYRPTVHIAIDSTKTNQDVLDAIEDIIWGTPDTNPRLPPIDEIRNLFKALGVLVIVDNGDGTWTAIDQSNDYISMIDSTTFQINNADATYLDATTYEISTTYPDDE